MQRPVKKVMSEELTTGMKLARAVMVEDTVLLEKGEILSERYIRNIKNRDVRYVFIEEYIDRWSPCGMSPEADPKDGFCRRIIESLGSDPVPDSAYLSRASVKSAKDLPCEVFQEAYCSDMKKLENLFAGFAKDQEIREENARQIVEDLVHQVKQNPRQSFNLTYSESLHNYLLSHSLNTTYLSVLVGHLSGMIEEELMTLGLSALLHDIGMLKLGNPVWNFPRNLDELERFDVMKHTIYGFDCLSSCPGLPKEVGYVAYSHHERTDGTGYPRNKQGNLISEFAQIVAVCDVFAAMVSQRPYRKRNSLAGTIAFFNSSKTKGFNRFYTSLLTDFITRHVDPSIWQEACSKNTRNSGDKLVTVVDESPDVASMILCASLKRHNFLVSCVSKANDLPESVESDRPDLMIIIVRENSGRELAGIIAQSEQCRTLPFIALSISQELDTTGAKSQFDIVSALHKVKKAAGTSYN
ncbi:MAG: HD domain-containing protein [Candidatus Wallbacteria bacterium]|nr:HD domain-containing protein [Candidatus Wallbacteria bacterium]